MFSLIRSLFLFVCLFQSSLMADEINEVFLIQNMKDICVLPKKFRTTHDTLRSEKSVPQPSMLGFKELNASGSGQYSESGLSTLVQALNHPKNLYLVDLREESHGFLNGIAVSWYAPQDWGNQGKPLKQIKKEEKRLLEGISKEQNVSVYEVLSKTGTGYIEAKKPLDIAVRGVSTESSLAASMGLHYIRLPVTDHCKPDDECIKNFVNFVKNLPGDAWVHFHCSGGEGRSSCFLIMYDMMHNAKKVSFEDILNRHWLIGGHRFESLPDPSNWKYAAALERLNFLKQFYRYCRDNDEW